MNELEHLPAESLAADRITMMQLNPFALPSETRGWFRMLVVAALAAAVNIGVALTRLTGRDAEFQRLWKEHAVLIGQVADSAFFKLTAVERMTVAERAGALIQKMLEISLGNLLIPLLYVLILSALAVLIYRRHPQRIRKKFRSLPLTEEKAPTVVGDLKRMVAALDLSPAPSLEHSQDIANLHEAQAFGLKGSPALLLKATPELLEKLWDDKYRAVALHELAHIKEGDAQDRERARAVWLALSVLGFLPLALRVLASSCHAWINGSARPSFHPLEILSAQLTLTSLIVLFIMAGLIRIRELYADWRVTFGGLSEPLITAFGPSRWWHPSEKLFRISSGLPLQTGLLLALVLGNGLGFGLVLLQAGMILGQREQWHVFASLAEQPAGWKSSFAIVSPIALDNFIPLLVGAILFFFIALVVSGTLDLQVQRAAVADLASGKHESWGYLKLLRPAFLLAIGFEAGQLLAPGMLAISPSQDALWSSPLRAIAMTLFSWVWLVSIRAFSRFSLGSHAARESPRRQYRRGAWFLALVFALLCCPLGRAFLGLRAFQNTTTMDLQSSGQSPDVYFFYYLGTPILQILLQTTVLYVLVAGLVLGLVARSLFLSEREPHEKQHRFPFPVLQFRSGPQNRALHPERPGPRRARGYGDLRQTADRARGAR